MASAEFCPPLSRRLIPTFAYDPYLAVVSSELLAGCNQSMNKNSNYHCIAIVVKMLSLTYLAYQNGPTYHFELTSDVPVDLDPNRLHIAAYKTETYAHPFSLLSFETLSSDKFILGELSCKRAQDESLRASVQLRPWQGMDEKNKIVSCNEKVTILLLAGILSKCTMLEVKASFDVEINNFNMITYGEAVITKHFDTRTSLPQEDNSLVVLPKRKKNKHYKQKTRRAFLPGSPLNHLNMFGYIFEENEVVLPVKKK